LPDPVDPECPGEFIKTAKNLLAPLGYRSSKESTVALRQELLRFVGDFSDWESGSKEIFLETAQKLLRAAQPQGNHVVFDPFSGNGAIPGEALRLGCDSIALDLNPVALLILRTLLDAVPKHGQELLDLFRKGSKYIKNEANRRLSKYYPKRDGRTPIAWLWARTVVCEGPGCGAEIPLISQTIIAKGKRKVWIEISGDTKTKYVAIHLRKGPVIPGNLIRTAGGGAAVCPVCGMTTPKSSVKRQGQQGRMGHRLYGMAVPIGERQGKEYFDATETDRHVLNSVDQALARLQSASSGNELSEKFPFHDPRAFTAGLYGVKTWGDLFSNRQKLALYIIAEILSDFANVLTSQNHDSALIRNVVTALALAISNSVHYWTYSSTWLSEGMISSFITGNAIAMRWDYAEANPLTSGYAGGLDFAFNKAEDGLSSISSLGKQPASVLQGDATNLPLPDDSANLFFTDPPYYDVVPYADLSDLCYVWLKRFVGQYHPDLFSNELTPKAEQIVVNPYSQQDGRGEQTAEQYQRRMTQAFMEGRRVLRPDGIGAIVFAHKGTAAWEAMLSAITDAGFIVTASWPIDTERASRMRANKSAALGSSVHIVVRPRENEDGSLRNDEIGEWREILRELPSRIHDWLPRLAQEGVVGADAIFACLGPALEIFSRYSRVEKASGETVTLKEYLEQVWAAVSREALSMIFEGAEGSGLEEDARLTAMWLWTLSTGGDGLGGAGDEDESPDDEEGEKTSKAKSAGGFALEFDAARKIAQGLGIHMDQLKALVEIKGDVARLLPVSERAGYLFGQESSRPQVKRKKEPLQPSLFQLQELSDDEAAWEVPPVSKVGETVLDRVHQSMLLFAGGRSEALKRFLVEEGAGRDTRFWKLAQALSALYPTGSEEKRWVDGVLARKKGLGF